MRVSPSPHAWRIGLIGYGEVGRILAEDLRGKGIAAVSTMTSSWARRPKAQVP